MNLDEAILSARSLYINPKSDPELLIYRSNNGQLMVGRKGSPTVTQWNWTPEAFLQKHGKLDRNTMLQHSLNDIVDRTRKEGDRLKAGIDLVTDGTRRRLIRDAHIMLLKACQKLNRVTDSL